MRSISLGMAAYALAHWRICAHYVFQGSRLSMVGKGFLPSPPLKLTKPVSHRTPERAARQKQGLQKLAQTLAALQSPLTRQAKFRSFRKFRGGGEIFPPAAFCSPSARHTRSIFGFLPCRPLFHSPSTLSRLPAKTFFFVSSGRSILAKCSIAARISGVWLYGKSSPKISASSPTCQNRS